MSSSPVLSWWSSTETATIPATGPGLEDPNSQHCREEDPDETIQLGSLGFVVEPVGAAGYMGKAEDVLKKRSVGSDQTTERV
jgi:hypothetical protein